MIPPATKVSARTNLINMPESDHQPPNPEEGGSDGARDNSSDGAAAVPAASPPTAAVQGEATASSEKAAVPAASPPTAAVEGEATASSEKVARKRWKLPSFPKLPSLPILKILQGTMKKVNGDSLCMATFSCFQLTILYSGIFLVIMIGQSLPGAEKSFWPFNKVNNALDNNTNAKPITPFYAEMRSDLYGHERQFPKTHEPESGVLMTLLFGPKQDPAEPTIPVNTGIPAEQHIVLQHLNREYEAYRFSVQAATTSKIQASREFGQVSFRRVLEKVLSRLKDLQDRQRLTVLEESFLEEGGRLVDKLATLRTLLVDSDNTTFGSLQQCHNNTEAASLTIPFLQTPSREMQHVCDNIENSTDLSSTKNDSSVEEKKTLAYSTNTTLLAIKMVENKLTALVTAFLKQISESFPPGSANAIKDALGGHFSIWGTRALIDDLRKTPMRTLFSNARKRKRLFVTYFVGDVFASTVAILRKEVTAIVRSAEPGDEALVVLQSAGGTVTGYGLAAAQLLRIKEAGLALTIAVEQVAASGGYMAACVGDTIICSPFAVVGSIGVIQDMPNIYERLKREGVEFHQISAGEYKRVLSPTKEVKQADLKKAKEEMEDVWTLFKDFVSEQRPALKIDAVATGEAWYGKRALELGLCDALQAADDVLIGFIDRGYDVYHVKYEVPDTNMLSKFLEFGKASTSSRGDVGLLQWFLEKIVAQLQVELGKIGIGIDNNRLLLV